MNGQFLMNFKIRFRKLPGFYFLLVRMSSLPGNLCCKLEKLEFAAAYTEWFSPFFSPRNTVFLLKGCQVVIEYKSNRKKFIFSLFLRFSQCVSLLWNVSRLKSPTWKVEIVTVHLICQSSHSSHSMKIMNFDAIIDF